MARPSAPALLRAAVMGVLAAATLLSGCGRKGPLELPPSTQASGSTGQPASGQPAPAMTRDGYPIAPPGQKRSTPLDWLID